LAVVPNPNEMSGRNATQQRDIVFGLAQEASSGGGDEDNSEEQIRRTITMVRAFVYCIHNRIFNTRKTK
jgi:hypothetical protein